jgi:hypothetical protein
LSVAELRRRAKKTIDELSGAKLRFITDFLGYVKEGRSEDATKELLEIPGFIESFSRGKKDIRGGRATPWRKVRRDV